MEIIQKRNSAKQKIFNLVDEVSDNYDAILKKITSAAGSGSTSNKASNYRSVSPNPVSMDPSNP